MHGQVVSCPAMSDSAVRRSWLIPAIIFLLALVPRLALVHQTIHQHPANGPAGAFTDIAGDSGQYMALARNFVQLGHFADDRPTGRKEGTTYFALLRPPIYPLYCAVFEKLGCPAGILWGQAILGAVGSAMIAWPARTICRSNVAAAIAGGCSALSPTGIGLAGLVLADLPFAVVFVAGLIVLWRAGASRIWLWHLAGAIFGVTCLIKPVGLYWPFVMPLVAILFLRSAAREVPWRHVLGASATAITILLAWAAHNRVSHGVFAVSTVDAQNLRYYLSPIAEEWAKAGDSPTARDVRANRTAVMSRDDLDRRKQPAADMVRRQWSEGLAIVRAHPKETWNAYWDSVDRQLASSFDHFELEMPAGGFVHDALRSIEKLTDTNGAYWTCVVLMIVPLVLPWLTHKTRRDPSWRSRAFAAPALWITFLYFAHFVGTTTGTGSRILYPAEAPALLLIACGVISIVRDGARLGRAA